MAGVIQVEILINKGCTSMNHKTVTFLDTTFRDGAQSLWGMKAYCAMIDAVISEMDEGGFASIETIAAGQWVPWVRFFKDDPIAGMALFEKKLQKTPMVCVPALGVNLNFTATPSPMPLVRYFYQTMFDIYKGKWKRE